MDYLKLATTQFFALKEEVLDENRHALGSGNEVDYEIDGIKFKITVDGCWEKSTWFDWEVFDDKGNKVAGDTEY